MIFNKEVDYCLIIVISFIFTTLILQLGYYIYNKIDNYYYMKNILRRLNEMPIPSGEGIAYGSEVELVKANGYAFAEGNITGCYNIAIGEKPKERLK